MTEYLKCNSYTISDTYVSSSSGQLCAHAGDGNKELFLRCQVNIFFLLLLCCCTFFVKIGIAAHLRSMCFSVCTSYFEKLT